MPSLRKRLFSKKWNVLAANKWLLKLQRKRVMRWLLTRK